MILDGLFERRAEEVAGGTLTDKGWIASLIASTGGRSTSGIAVDEWKAEGIPAAYACQRAISETCGQIPTKILDLADGKKQPAVMDPVYYVLHDLANPELTAYEFKEMMSRWLVGWGNAYAEIVRDAHGRVIELWPLVPWRMKVDRTSENIKRWTYVAPNGRKFEWLFDADQPPIMHLKVNSNDGLVGRSPIRVLMDSIGLTLAVNQFGADWFNNYASPAVTLSHPKNLSPVAAQNLRESWEKLRGEWGQKHRMAVLTEGMKLEKMSSPPDEAQFIETKSFQIEETARIYRVPLFVIQHMTKNTSWGTGVEQIMLGWLSTGLSPYLVSWSQVIMRDLLTRRMLGKQSVAWMTQVIVTPDFKTHQEGLKIQKESGVITPNQWRDFMEMNPRTDDLGDQYDVSIANTMPASLAIQKFAGESPKTGAAIGETT